MKRKLFSTLLCAFALLLLMGAGVEPDSAAALVIEEESTFEAQEEQVLETGIPTGKEESDDEQSQGVPASQAGAEEETEELVQIQSEEQPALDKGFLIDGQPVSKDTARVLKDGVTYVAMSPVVKALEPQAQVSWDGGSRTVTVQTPALSLSATVGQLYIVANGRYLYIQDGVQMQDDRVMVPLRILTEAFDAKLNWDGATNTVYIQRGSGALQPGESYYDQDELFWLSRIIYAESGNQPLKGQIAVGNVVMNRVASPSFPNTIIEVLAQKNQFTTYAGGKLANRTPNASSIIAAKLVLDGGVVEETEGALYFDSQAKSWAARYHTCISVIGGHKFYQ